MFYNNKLILPQIIWVRNFILLFICFSFFISCTKLDVFEKSVFIPSQSWMYDNKPKFSVTITDTSSFYNIYLVLRHTDAYKYNNIWLNFGSQAPGDRMRFQNINLNLASDAKGWEGKGMDDIFEVRKLITPGPVPFKRAGTYTFTVSQIMRENPLKHILNVGVRVEKVNM